MRRTLLVFISVFLGLIVLCAPLAALGQTTIVLIGRQEGSGTRDLFQSLAMEGADYASNVEVKLSHASAHDAVTETPAAIGFVSLGYIDEQVKALQITVDGVATSPTSTDILSGDYPITRGFYMITNGAPDAGLEEEFIDYVLSSDGQEIVEDHSYVPLAPKSWTQPSSLSGELSITGGTAIVPIIQDCVDNFTVLFPDVTFTLSASTSTAGISAVGQDTVDISLASRVPKDTEKTDYPNLESFNIAKDAIAIIVNPVNTITELTLAEIKGIYTGTITTWEDVGGGISAASGFLIFAVMGALALIPILKRRKYRL